MRFGRGAVAARKAAGERKQGEKKGCVNKNTGFFLFFSHFSLKVSKFVPKYHRRNLF